MVILLTGRKAQMVIISTSAKSYFSTLGLGLGMSTPRRSILDGLSDEYIVIRERFNTHS